MSPELFHKKVHTSQDWFQPQEQAGPTQPTLNELLNEAWTAIKGELETNHSSAYLIDLRRSYGDRLRAWWGGKKLLHGLNARKMEDGKPINGAAVKIGDEEISVRELGVYEGDDRVLEIKHTTPTSESEISITAEESWGIDRFMSPPTIKSKHRETPTDQFNLQWEVVFRGTGISTFTKTTVHEDPEYRLPYVKQLEVIDVTAFGVDRT